MQQIKRPSDRNDDAPAFEDSATVSEGITITRPAGSISWLSGLDASDRQSIVNAAWEDMRRRQKNGERIRAEEYLAQQGDKVDEDLAVDVIYGEYVLRYEAGEAPDVQEFVERFPIFASAIKRQLDVHDGMESVEEGQTFELTRPSDVALAQEEKPAKPPTHAGKYVLLAKLSSGGQATVYRAVHPTLGRELVLKLGHKSLVQNSPAATRLLDEGRILADLDHPNLARIYDMGLDEGYPYLAMEYIRGRTLDHYVQEEKIGWCERARIVAKVAAAVSAAHRRNVVHLDIKPKNIVVDEHGEPRLVDFGLARLFDAFRGDTDEGDISGTLQYMAPEQARGDGALIGRRTDIFGMGGVLYYLLTSKVPYPGKKTSELLPRIGKGEWDAEPLKAASIPRPLKAICMRAMAPSVDDRYRSADDFASALNRYVRFARFAPLAKKAAALLIVLFAAILLVRQLWPTTVATNPTLAANVRQPDGHFTQLANALPLSNGDELQFHGEVPAGMHAAMFLFNSSGELQKLESWEPHAKVRQLQFPKGSSASVPLEGRPGTEFIFLCTREGAPITLDEVRNAWQGSKPFEPLPDYTVATIDSGEIRFENFGKGLGAAIERENPESVFKQRLEAVLEAFKSRFSGVAGIAFTHRR